MITMMINANKKRINTAVSRTFGQLTASFNCEPAQKRLALSSLDSLGCLFSTKKSGNLHDKWPTFVKDF